MNQYEWDYCHLIKKILREDKKRITRNGTTLGTFGETLIVHDLAENFPLLQGRKIFYKGVLGEFAAMIRGPKHVNDFKRFGCNYWDKFADDSGAIFIDYGNQWLDFNGTNQLELLVEGLKADPYGRRHIINAWRPDHLSTLSLPCCHLLYQWYVTAEGKLDMIWYQRSVDVMIGLPSDVVLAAIFNLLVAKEVGLKVGRLIFMLGDCHIYAEHLPNVPKYLESAYCRHVSTFYSLDPFAQLLQDDTHGELFVPSMLQIDYDVKPVINFELKV